MLRFQNPTRLSSSRAYRKGDTDDVLLAPGTSPSPGYQAPVESRLAFQDLEAKLDGWSSSELRWDLQFLHCELILQIHGYLHQSGLGSPSGWLHRSLLQARLNT